ncbi:hypothetical protein CRM96_14325 [Enterococcus durans]|uniref:Uncharacterized protein n=1 Tax=Enterococcus durans TaxID=53345 RepID=A0AB36SAV6_9ENTE|nr:hypothetical protein CJZ72_04980 [Enterococcus durans]PEH46076.1 hypothetical protein CRM96_14325 [Enterococcus durans]
MEFDPATLHSYISLLVFNCFILQENSQKVILKSGKVIVSERRKSFHCICTLALSFKNIAFFPIQI